MVQHEDKFFQKVADSFSGFAPEAPADIYAVVQKRYGLAAFLGWNVMRFNVYYALLLCSVGAGALFLNWGDCAQTAREAKPLLLEKAILLKAQQSIVESVTAEVEVPSAEVSMASSLPKATTKSGSSAEAKQTPPTEASAEVAASTETNANTETIATRVKKDRKSLKVNEVKEVVAPKN